MHRKFYLCKIQLKKLNKKSIFARNQHEVRPSIQLYLGVRTDSGFIQFIDYTLASVYTHTQSNHFN